MQLKSKTISLDGVDYVVKELSARVMLPLVQQIADKEQNQEAQINMMSASVSVNDQLIDAGELGMTAFMKLMPVVQELNGMAVQTENKDEGDEGNA